VAKRIPGTDNRVLRVCRLLNRYRVRYVLAGGVAANLHGSVRATKDVDILVPRDPRNMAKLLSLGDLKASKQTGRAADMADLEALEQLGGRRR
jgi:hypothetical protein